ncbi:MAG: Flagellar hook-length control protein FliK [Chthoniobacteraceae bacterium]|nr:Flagellar hook-length control protein FliK [Chthoniobacteraceae bacterium]
MNVHLFDAFGTRVIHKPGRRPIARLRVLLMVALLMLGPWSVLAPANSAPGRTTLMDTTAPVLMLHPNVTQEASSVEGAKVLYAPVIAKDDSELPPAIVYSRKSGTMFPLGVTTVYVVATDASGNSSSTNFTVTVSDRTAPVVSVHVNVTAEASSVAGAYVAYVPGIATDAVTPNPAITYSKASGSLFPIGVTTVTIMATDAANNVGTRTFTVKVADTKAPVISPHVSVYAEAASADGAIVTYAPAGITEMPGGTAIVTYSKESGALFPIGATSVTITAIDTSGHVATSTFMVTVRDKTAPSLLIPASIVVEASSAAGAVVNYTAPRAADSVDTAPVVLAAPASGSTFPIGTTTVRVTATDLAGNSSSDSFTVTVRGAAAPILTLISPRAGQKVTGGELVFSGHASEGRGVARVEVTINGGMPQVVAPDTLRSDFAWTLSVVPENGLNTAVVKAYGLFNNPSLPIACTFTFVNSRPEFAGTYNGLLRANSVSPSAIDEEGLVRITVLSSGVFTGKITLSKTSFPIRGVFLKDGHACFDKTNAPGLELIKKSASAGVSLGRLSLTLDTTLGTERISGALTRNTATIALIDHADRALHTAKKDPIPPLMNVPVALLDPYGANSRYRALMSAAAGAGDLPQGEGWVRTRVAANGRVRLVGKLADGAALSYSNALSRTNELPIFVPLYAGKGLLTGPLLLGSVETDTNLVWYKKASVSDKRYPAGWPAGIHLELVH